MYNYYKLELILAGFILYSDSMMSVFWSKMITPVSFSCRLMKPCLVFLSVLSVICFHFRSGHAEDLKPLELVTGEYPPYVSPSLPNHGSFAKRLDSILRQNGYQVTLKFYPWARCEQLVKNDVFPATFPYVTSDDRLKQFLFSKALMHTVVVFFYYGQNPVKEGMFQELSELRHLKIGAIKGYYYEPEFKHIGLNMLYSYNEVDSLRALKLGRIDLFPIDRKVGSYLIHTHFSGDNAFKTIDRPILSKGLRVMVSRTHPQGTELLNAINQSR